MKISDYQEIIGDLKPYLESFETECLSALEMLQPYGIVEKNRQLFSSCRRRPRSIPLHRLDIHKIVGGRINYDKHIKPEFSIGVSYLVALLLSKKDLHIPFNSEMSEMLKLADISFEDIDDMVLNSPLAFPTTHPRPEKGGIVYLLTKAMSNSIQTRSTDRLIALDSFMLSHDILEENLEGYQKFWKDFSLNMVRLQLSLEVLKALRNQTENIRNAKLREVEEIYSILDRIEENLDNDELSLVPHPMMEERLEARRDLSKAEDAIGLLYESILQELKNEETILYEKMDRFIPPFIDTVDIARGLYSSLLEGDESLGMPIMTKVLSRFSLICPDPHVNLENPDLNDVSFKKEIRIYDEKEFRRLELTDDGWDDSFPSKVPVASIIASISNCSVSDSLYIKHSVLEYFRSLGFSERRARDLSIVVAMKESMIEDFDFDSMEAYLNNFYPDSNVKEVSGSPEKDEEILKLNRKLEEYEKKLRDSEKEKKSYRHEIKKLETLLEEEKERHENLIEEILKENDIEKDEKESSTLIEYPYHTDKKITLYGGFDVFHKEMKKLLPDLKIVEPCYKSPNLETFRKSDMVFIQPNKLNHGNYFAVRDASKNANVPYYHLRYACARKCADFIVGEIESHNF